MEKLTHFSDGKNHHTNTTQNTTPTTQNTTFFPSKNCCSINLSSITYLGDLPPGATRNFFCCNLNHRQFDRHGRAMWMQIEGSNLPSNLMNNPITKTQPHP